jgi:flavin reductase (DIM6/NTAB) family NADH-FMN oxidoreductase RutF
VPDDLQESGAPTFEAAQYRQVMGRFATGVTIITAIHEREPAGFTAQTFVPLSIDPPLVSFCPQKTSTSWPKIEAAGAFCVNILSDDQEALCRAFASSGGDKFRGIGWHPGPSTGAPVLQGVIAWVEGRIEAVHDGGDHLVVVGRVLDLASKSDRHPLLFYRGGFGRFDS